MAAESLEKKAAELGCFIKVETRGSGGAKNVLTAKEIEEADCIIVAADTKVPMDRFAGKPVIICQVSDGISKADKLIQRAMAKDAPIYKGSGEASENESMGGESFGHKVYKHLMNGVSHMLPFVVGGGIMIAIALGTLFFKNKFTAEERKAGPTNFIMGLSFITEGAIPFAAADPLRVIPACVVGSAIAGAMSMAFNCTLMAPHGGIFVFLVMGNAIWYLLSLIVGSAVSCLLLGLLKKKIV